MSILAEMRKRAKLTQKELAVACGISKSAVQAYEYGYISLKEASYGTIEALCEALKCRAKDLF